jgi:hypothetical protein
MDSVDHGQIETALHTSVERTFKVVADGRTIWVKRPRRGPGYTLYGLQALAAWLLRLPTLYPPRVSRGSFGLAAEARRLEVLARRGWPVPRVLGLTERWLALGDNGVSVPRGLRDLGIAQRSDAARAALEFIQSLHAGGGWHGAAQLRNITRLPHGFGVIDFEDDLEPSMPLELRQTRDILLLVLSASRFSKTDDTLVPLLLADAVRRAPAPVNAELISVGRKLMGAHRLIRPFAPYLGREGPAMASMADAFRRL